MEALRARVRELEATEHRLRDVFETLELIVIALDLDAKSTIRITQNEGSNEEPSFSPNGRAIAFARAGQGVFLTNADGTGKAVKVWSGSATGIDWGPTPAP